MSLRRAPQVSQTTARERYLVELITDQNSSGRSEIQAWLNQITKKRTKLSGREIRNMLTTAQMLAQAEPSKKSHEETLVTCLPSTYGILGENEENKTTQQALLNASYS